MQNKSTVKAILLFMLVTINIFAATSTSVLKPIIDRVVHYKGTWYIRYQDVILNDDEATERVLVDGVLDRVVNIGNSAERGFPLINKSYDPAECHELVIEIYNGHHKLVTQSDVFKFGELSKCTPNSVTVKPIINRIFNYKGRWYIRYQDVHVPFDNAYEEMVVNGVVDRVVQNHLSEERGFSLTGDYNKTACNEGQVKIYDGLGNLVGESDIFKFGDLTKCGTVPPTADTIKPVITLIGDAIVTLSVGDSYSDAGATASDNIDGDITSDINVTSNVDTAVAGSYYVKYNVADSSGNKADEVIREVKVLEAYNPQTTQEVVLCQNQSAYISTLYTLGMTINSTTSHGSVLSKGNDFVGAVVCSKFENEQSSGDVLNRIKNSAFPTATTIIRNNNTDGSIKAQYELTNVNTQAFAELKTILQAIGESDFSNYVDYSSFASIQNLLIDVFVKYVDSTTTYIIVTVSDKSVNNINSLNTLVTPSIIKAANSQAIETDEFTYGGNTLKADILFIMDDSGSMSNEQQAASDAIVRTFGAAMSAKGVDWKATVIGTERSRDYLNRYISDPSFNDIAKLSQQLLLGTNGYDEVGLLKAYTYLTNGDIVIRPDSKLSIVYASDEIAHTRLSELGGVTDINDSYFVQNNIKFNVIIPENLSTDSNLAYVMANRTGGEVANIYNYATGYDAMMQKIADDAAGSASQIVLSRAPIIASIQVLVNGTIMNSGWTYNPSNNSIVFDVASAPNAGDSISVIYNY